LSAPERERDDASDPVFVKALKRVLYPWRRNAESHLSYRRCPKCGERDLRLSDRHRPEPSVYRSRIFVLKWLCLSCDYRETETIEEIE
jgi:hypothetical protein